MFASELHLRKMRSRSYLLRALVWMAPILGAALWVPRPCSAELLRVTITGEVEFNQITDPPLGDANPADTAVVTFLVDSDVFVDSPSFPTRGYEIDPASFSWILGAVEVGLQSPFPPGEVPYFVLRDNDPAVDGFFVATDVDFPIGVPLDQVGVFEQFRGLFSVTYEGDVLSSLDIVDGIGSYDFDQLTVFGWTVDDGAFSPMGLVFDQMTILAEGSIFGDSFESGDVSAW